MIEGKGNHDEHPIRWDQENAPHNVDQREYTEQPQRPMLKRVHVVQDILVQPELQSAQYQQYAPQQDDYYNVQS